MKLSRLRRGEVVASLSALALVLLVFLAAWFSFTNPDGSHTNANGWTSLPTLRWLILVTGATGLLLGYFQAAREAPALPVSWDVIVVTLSAMTTVILLIRVLTGEGSPRLGAFAGLAAVAALAAGSFASLREEGGWTPGPEHPIATITIGETGGSTPPR